MQLRLFAARDGAEGSLTIHTDARIYLAELAEAGKVRHELAAGRHTWLQVLRGSVAVNGIRSATSDGVAISEESLLAIKAQEYAEVMLFDLA